MLQSTWLISGLVCAARVIHKANGHAFRSSLTDLHRDSSCLITSLTAPPPSHCPFDPTFLAGFCRVDCQSKRPIILDDRRPRSCHVQPSRIRTADPGGKSETRLRHCAYIVESIPVIHSLFCVPLIRGDYYFTRVSIK